MARIAFILLCHKDPKGIIAQAQRLTGSGDFVSIHFDARANPADFDMLRQALAVVGDGPTSPEALKALTDPPEPPPVPAGGGVVGGDGQAPSPGAGVGFDGFSATAPADPNAPLINPGILLRGAH